MGAFSEFDRTTIVLKTRSARERMRKSGAFDFWPAVPAQNVRQLFDTL
jgi:hypothetical protein